MRPNITDLELHQTICIGGLIGSDSQFYVTRVPNGLIYHSIHYTGITNMIFVPFDEFKEELETDLKE